MSTMPPTNHPSIVVHSSGKDEPQIHNYDKIYSPTADLDNRNFLSTFGQDYKKL